MEDALMGNSSPCKTHRTALNDVCNMKLVIVGANPPNSINENELKQALKAWQWYPSHPETPLRLDVAEQAVRSLLVGKSGDAANYFAEVIEFLDIPVDSVDGADLASDVQRAHGKSVVEFLFPTRAAQPDGGASAMVGKDDACHIVGAFRSDPEGTRLDAFINASKLATQAVIQISQRLLSQREHGTTANQFALALVRPAGHHSTFEKLTPKYYTGINHVMVSALKLADERDMAVGVFDPDVHFATGSQDIAMKYNDNAAKNGGRRHRGEVIHSDVSSGLLGSDPRATYEPFMFGSTLERDAQAAGHLVFATQDNRSNYFPFLQITDATLIYATLQTVEYFKRKNVEFIFVSLGLDAGAWDGANALVTKLGFAMMASVLRESGLPCVFALEGGGYADAATKDIFQISFLEASDDAVPGENSVFGQNVQGFTVGLLGKIETVVDGNQLIVPEPSEECMKELMEAVEALKSLVFRESPVPYDQVVPCMASEMDCFFNARILPAVGRLQQKFEELYSPKYSEAIRGFTRPEVREQLDELIKMGRTKAG